MSRSLATPILLLILLLHHKASGLHPVQRQGFLGDKCVVGEPCVPPRICIDPNVTPRDTCSAQSTNCFCGHPDLRDSQCSCDNPCPPGERCTRTQLGDNVCLSRLIPGVNLPCFGASNPSLGGFNFETCRLDADCAASHSCRTRLPDDEYFAPCRDGDNQCFCDGDDPVQHICSCQRPNCLPGEKCVSSRGSELCVSIAFNDPDIVCNFTTPAPQRPPTATKFTDEPCVTSDDCAGPRSCVMYKGNSLVPCVGNDNERFCMCLPDEFKDYICSCESQECLEGDVCSFLSPPLETFCVSEMIGHALICEDSDVETPTIAPDEMTVSPDIDRKKYSYEYCRTDDECADRRVCMDNDGNKCLGTRECTCQMPNNPFQRCSCKNSKCAKGDICGFHQLRLFCHSVHASTNPNQCPPTVQPTITSAAFIPPDASAEETPAVSPDDTSQTIVSPEPIPTDGVCVDARALAHLDSRDLVFQQHALSRVLCDRFGSCATPGHMVRYMGSAMMMSRYCESVGCVERVMEVNSPRYRRGMRVASRTDGLEYTAFAARYGTRGEEAVLAAAVRVGL